MNDKIENLLCHPVTLARVLLCRGSLQTDRLTLFCFCSAVFGQASERADMSQSTVDVAGRVTVEELHSPFFFFSFLSSLPLCIYADDKLSSLLPPA